MSGEDNFIARWSRLKREAAEGKPTDTEVEAPKRESRAGAAEPSAQVPHGEPAQADEPPFDPAALPPIDSIVADSDIRAFLQKGIPADLTKAALRRAWSADPAIRDFIGLVESQWDFADPTAMPGFGPLEATDELHNLVSQAIGRLPVAPEETGREVAAGATADAPTEPTKHEQVDDDGSNDDSHATATASALQHSEPAEKRPQPPPGESGTGRHRKGHGRALPR
jgi:hypothetical protein